MAKLMYSLKLALMEQRITALPRGAITSTQQTQKVKAFAQFVAHIYATWVTCERVVDAAWNDLQLYRHLQAYKSVDKGIAESALKALGRHLWNLTGEILPLALFSDKVLAAERRALADAIMEHKPADFPVRVPREQCGADFGKQKFPALSPSSRLADLANADCWLGIQHLHIDPAFLALSTEDWVTNAAFQARLANVQAINTFNDCAEQGVKLASDFVGAAKSEQHLQNVLQAVQHDGSLQPNLRRSKRKMAEAKN
ncbi:hypothetical protein FJT64_021878 [Amphibalanus amphitrite]|uniref:Uncharacterized protein n=1 Tax=Amphibalanus amphitrite TaxID=1232801 RepID=A0A6A4WW87_AMPAM|nr:hypothetical protein FJT64_021878 [Amphibalanus amphitrite]